MAIGNVSLMLNKLSIISTVLVRQIQMFSEIIIYLKVNEHAKNFFIMFIFFLIFTLQSLYIFISSLSRFLILIYCILLFVCALEHANFMNSALYKYCI